MKRKYNTALIGAAINSTRVLAPKIPCAWRNRFVASNTAYPGLYCQTKEGGLHSEEEDLEVSRGEAGEFWFLLEGEEKGFWESPYEGDGDVAEEKEEDTALEMETY